MMDNSRQDLNTSGYRRNYNENFVSGVFNDRDSAEQAYNELKAQGYTDEDITLMMSDETRDRYFKDSDGDDVQDTALSGKATDNAGKGSLIGGGIGAAIGAIAAIGTNVLLPGLGLVVAGPIAAGLAGAGAGALTGGLIGALTGAGVPEDEARHYEQRIKDGGIYMGFKPRDHEYGRDTYNRWNRTTDDDTVL